MEDKNQVGRTEDWIGFELHDGLLQWLNGAKMNLEASICAEPDQESVAKSSLEMAVKSLGLAIEEGRELIRYLDQNSQSGIHIDVPDRISDFIEKQVVIEGSCSLESKLSESLIFDQPTGWQILRITQQAIWNAITHSSAKRILVSAKCVNQQVCFSVQDDGIGFDPNQVVAAGHFGLSGMKRRAAAIGANLQIMSAPGKGTEVRLTVESTSAKDSLFAK